MAPWGGRAVAGVVLAACLLWPGHAAAGRDSDLPRPDITGKWRVVTDDDRTTPSRCIGKPVTPLCALETVIACRLRDDNWLCQIARGWESPPLFTGDGLEGSYAFRILGARYLRKQDILPPRPSNESYPLDPHDRVRAGDMEITTIEERRCAICRPWIHVPEMTFFLRRTRSGWRVVTWEGERYADPRF